MSKSKKLFLYLSIAIAFIDGLFVMTNHYYTRQTFHNSLQNDSQNYYAIYKTVLESTYNGLSMQATIFGGDKRIQDLFLQGKKALEKEGGTRGGAETARIRNELYQLVAKAWKDATKKFDVRQLHFHLGPGSFTFLRVHKPEKFGDRMDNLRFIIVDTNAEQKPKIGFETGRVYSGLRSVVPIFAWDKDIGKQVYVGALEVGTSYKTLLQTIDKNLNIQLSVLLNDQHIKKTVWEEFLTGEYNNNTIKNCDCVLEASSQQGQMPLLGTIFTQVIPEQQLIHADKLSRIVKYDEQFYSVTFHPLRDYLGEKDPSRDNIGAVLISRNITPVMTTYHEEQRVNILYGIIAYFIVEILLLLTFINVTRRLTSQVILQTKKLSEQKKTIELDKIKYKNLAEAINRNYFFYTRNKHNQFHTVSSSITKILGYSEQEFLTNPLKYLPDNIHSAFVIEKAKRSFIDKGQNTFEVEIYNKDYRLKYLLVTETPKYEHGKKISLIEGLAQDITQTRLDKMLLQLNCRTMHAITDNEDTSLVLKELALGIESIIQDLHCAIMIYKPDEKLLTLAAAPHVDTNLKNILKKVYIDNPSASCCTSTKTAKRKITNNIFSDSDWKPNTDLLLKTPYKACISEPVLSSEAKVIATIDFYYEKYCSPNESDFAVLATATDLIVTLFEGKKMENLNMQ